MSIHFFFLALHPWLTGTQNIVDACFKLKIKRLIYTSSPSVVFDGVHGISNGDESLPYPPKVIDIIFFFSGSCLIDNSWLLFFGFLVFKISSIVQFKRILLLTLKYKVSTSSTFFSFLLSPPWLVVFFYHLFKL